jgi:hypothetical protein
MRDVDFLQLQDRVDALEAAHDTKTRASKAWEELFNERNRLWRDAEDKLDKVRTLLSENGCDCECDHHYTEHEDDCVPCLGCQISEALT